MLFNRFTRSRVILCTLLMVSPLFATKIHDISQLATGRIAAIHTPHSIAQLQNIVKTSKEPIAVAGGRFSQGGHIWYNNGITIDMKKLNAITLNLQHKKITVQAGATWQQIQKYIDPYNLSLKVMQSYNDFTVGGSLSVNVHGRTIAHGALIETIESIKLVLADGSLVTASRSEHYDLFKAAVGGYGAVGIITEATLSLTDNEIIERQETLMLLPQYPEYFKNMVRDNPSVVFHNADLSVTNYDTVSSITWHKSNKQLTETNRFQKNSTATFQYQMFQVARYMKGIQNLRIPLQASKLNQKVVLRNNEMSASVITAEPFTRILTTTVLQEYFVPCHKLEEFVTHLKRIAQTHDVNIMNVSIRYIHRDTESLMAYAQPEESFALVCYINMMNSGKGMQKAQRWTRELIDVVLDCGGTYYLPYQLHATKEQFLKAYPHAPELLQLKKCFDPHNRFMNTFIDKYLF